MDSERSTEDDDGSDASGETTYPERSYGWRVGWGWLPAEFPDAEAVNRGEDVYEPTRKRRLDEGIATVFLVAGVALILFPEPATTALGVVLVAVGVLAWVTGVPE